MAKSFKEKDYLNELERLARIMAFSQVEKDEYITFKKSVTGILQGLSECRQIKRAALEEKRRLKGLIKYGGNVKSYV